VSAVLAVCRPRTLFCVAADLTLPSEQIVRRTVEEWRTAPTLRLSGRPAMFLLGRD
jgi:16S rRNA (cytidine1402-2'-O)-methyltransferase